MNQSKHNGAESYGEGCAEFYDEIYGSVSSNVIDTLCDLAGKGRVLELGIGTGRIALPLRSRGVDISGVEASDMMISKLRNKPGGSEVPVIEGNFANVQLTGSFSLIFTLVSTFFLLRSRDEQQQCFQTVSELLSDCGIFLIETFKPMGASVTASNGQDISKEEIYTVDQIIETQQGSRRYRSVLCFAEPEELDWMAQKAGLRLKQRWRDWQRQPSLDNDLMHISLYERSN